MICRILVRINAAPGPDAGLIERVLADEVRTITSGQLPSLRLRKEKRGPRVEFVVTCDVPTVGDAAQMQEALMRRVRERLHAAGHRTPITIQASAFWRRPLDRG